MIFHIPVRIEATKNFRVKMLRFTKKNASYRASHNSSVLLSQIFPFLSGHEICSPPTHTSSVEDALYQNPMFVASLTS